MLGEKIQHVHFVGIGGTAMASVAAAMQERGFRVTGSDENLYPPMSTFLEEKGVPVHQGYSEKNLEPTPDLVVIGNAISRGNPEAESTLNRKLAYTSLAELLKHAFIQGKRSLVVTGTHGKSTTTALLIWVLECQGWNPSFLIGGVPANLGQGARFTDSPWFVVEGDEYDTAFFDKRSKFVHYQPEVAIINNLEFDHADIFRDLDDIQLSFQRMLRLVPGNGLVLANGDEENIQPLLDIPWAPVRRFGLGPQNEDQATHLGLNPDGSSFELHGETYRIPLVGEFNVRNALAVAATARHLGIAPEAIQRAFSSFKGLRRRMEVRGREGGVTVLDDFAHHPTAIRETLKALRVKFPDSRIWGIFEPRSNTTRRRVFQRELAEALGLADVAVVANVARLDKLPPEDRLDPGQLIDTLKDRGTEAYFIPEVPAIVELVLRQAKAGDVVCVLSNGGFGGIHTSLLQGLSERAC